MNPSLTLIYHSDPGHGWIAVSSKLIPIDIQRRITSFSYERRGTRHKTIYAEEDCDATLVLNYLKTRYDVTLKRVHTKGDKLSRIRNYPCYRAP